MKNNNYKNGKKSKNKYWPSDLLLHNTLGHCLVKKLSQIRQIGAEKSLTEVSIREKEKWTNKGTDMQEMADYFLHNITYHSQCLY